MRLGHLLGACLITLGLAACSVTAEDCAPGQVEGLLTALACEVRGLHAARQVQLRAAIKARVAEHRLTGEEVARLEAEAARLAGDRAAWQQRLAAMADDVAGLEAALEQVHADAGQDQAAVEALQVQSRALREELERAPQGGDRAALEAEIHALTLEVERRRQAIRALLEGSVAY